MRILRYSLFLLFIHFVCASNGQDFSLPSEDSQASLSAIHDFGFAGASVGVAFPMGSFSSKDFLNNSAGYADDGYYLNFINVHHRLSKHYAIGLNWTRSALNLDETEYISPLEDFYPDLTFLARNDDPWLLHSVMANGLITIPHSFVDIDVKVAIGIGHATRPKISITAFEKGTGFLALDWVQKESVINDVAWGFGTTARFHILPELDFFMAVDYLRFSTTFKVENVFYSSSVEQDNVKQTMEMMQVGVGFGYRLK